MLLAPRVPHLATYLRRGEKCPENQGFCNTAEETAYIQLESGWPLLSIRMFGTRCGFRSRKGHHLLRCCEHKIEIRNDLAQLIVSSSIDTHLRDSCGCRMDSGHTAFRRHGYFFSPLRSWRGARRPTLPGDSYQPPRDCHYCQRRAAPEHRDRDRKHLGRDCHSDRGTGGSRCVRRTRTALVDLLGSLS